MQEYFCPKTDLKEHEKEAYIEELNMQMKSIFNGWKS